MPTIVYEKSSGAITGIINGNIPYLMEHQDSIYVYETSISEITHFVENGEIKTLDTPRPDDDHKVDPDTKTWVRYRPAKNYERIVRQQRDQLIAATDWRVAKAAESGQSLDQVWIDYRQALRDITTQPGFPTDIVWPEKPL